MNSDAVSTLLAKNPSLKTAKAKLEAMEPGAFVMHKSWGFGQIKSYDENAGRLIIDFEGKPGHPMDPAFCVTTMDILPAKHLLVRQKTDAAAIARLIAEEPAELVAQALTAYDNNATTAIDLEITLAQVIGEEKFKKWWSAAKKAIAKDPRIAVPAKKTECYVLRDEPVSVESEIVEKFNGTRSARRRILLAEELLDTVARQEVHADFAAILKGVADAVKDSNQIDGSERLYGAAIRDQLAKLAGVDASTLEPSQSSLIAEARDLPALAEKIPVHFQREFLELTKVTHPIECRDILFNLLKSSQGKFTTEVINFLVENDYADDLAATFKRWQTEQNLRAPVLLWIVKNRHSKKFAKLLNELISPRLLSAIFFAIDYEALQAANARRIPLADALSEDQELIPDLLAAADAETARDLANTLMLNQGFEELTKKSLLARFIKIFPSIQSLVASDAESKDEQLIVSREHGDLKENSEYKMAKQDQQALMAQKTQLQRDLAHARISDFKDAPANQVGAGSIVDVKTDAGAATRYTILGAWDSDPQKNIISYKTPLGLALLSKKVGDRVTVKTGGAEENYTITKITRYVDAAS